MAGLHRIVPLLAAALLACAPPAIAREASASAAQTAESRFILLEGGRNFRDVGGYRTADGQQVKMHLLYRSGSLADLTPDGIARLDQLNIAAIVDLRSTDERRRDPNRWQQERVRGYWSRDYGLEQGGLSELFRNDAMRSPEAVRAMMTTAYRTLPKDQAASYRVLFARLLAPGRGAVVVNCTAGKDRTGVGTALVLTALGVPYDVIKQDFLLSNDAPGMNRLGKDLHPALAALPPESMRLLAGVDGTYLDAAFDAMRSDYGSPERYMERELGVGPAEIAALRKAMLTK